MIESRIKMLHGQGGGMRRGEAYLAACSHLVLFALLDMACGGHATDAGSVVHASSPIANLHAFARLYGVVRWFHPSDAAATIDWDRFAVEGSRRIVEASSPEALRSGLSELFAKIAPTVRVVGTGERVPNDPALQPRSVTGLDVVSWQHKGFGDSTLAGGEYVSKRRHRDKVVAIPGALFAALSQSVDATPYRGDRVRLQGKIRTGQHAQGRLWLRVERGEARGFFDNMERRPVRSESWTRAEIIGLVAPDATRIAFGPILRGGGTAWYDDLELSTELQDGTWKGIEIQNGGFEDGEVLRTWIGGTGRVGSPSLDGWSATVDHDRPATGASSLRLEPATKIVRDELFQDAPAPGEIVDIDLGSGLRARVPIALYSKNDRTIGDDPEVARRAQAAPRTTSADGFDPIAAVADVVVVWNVLEHFWPYWDLVSIDWKVELDTALRDALDDRSAAEHLVTLRRLIAKAPDGHGDVTCPGATDLAFPPFAVDFIENRIVVTASESKAIEQGDVILSIDGLPAAQLLAEQAALFSGSSQWRLGRGLKQLGRGPLGSSYVTMLHRGGADLRVDVTRIDHVVSEVPSLTSIERLVDGVYYVDLRRATRADIDAVVGRLAGAPGVVFDLRGYPNGNHQILSHLLTRPDDVTTWAAAPRVTRPDRAATPSSWDAEGWTLPALTPHIGGRVAFLTSRSSISYAESIMGLVEHYRLGEIVGATTAGTNGDIAQIAAPTGCTIIFTGRRVTRLDGSRFHLLGVQPTIPVSPTIAGVLAGRDEVLERALAYVRGVK
jgi:C-terminal processing protease CtpA/Prc